MLNVRSSQAACLPIQGHRASQIRTLCIGLLLLPTVAVPTKAAYAQPNPHTTIITVNGIGYDPRGRDDFVLPLQKLLTAKLGWSGLNSEQSRRTIRQFQNPSSISTSNAGLICWATSGFGHGLTNDLNAWANCPESGLNGDLAEATRQILGDIDDDITKDFAARISSFAGAARNVIIVAHSQGNLYAREAIKILARPSCIAVVSVATPDDGGWRQDVFRQSVAAAGARVADIILSTNKQTSITKRIRSTTALVFDSAVAAATPAQTLQTVFNASLALHSFRTYIDDDRTSQWIATAIARADSALTLNCR